VPYFRDYVRQYTDMPMLVRLVKQDGRYVPERSCALRLRRGSARPTIPTGRRRIDEHRRDRRAERLDRLPLGREGKWNLERRTPRVRET
jgi:nitrate reductase alpha subunit